VLMQIYEVPLKENIHFVQKERQYALFLKNDEEHNSH
jgi:hypothetical protein